MSSRRSVACNVFEYSGKFMGQEAKFKVTSVMGHVYSLDFPKEYNNWGAVDPVELYDSPVVKLEANPKVFSVSNIFSFYFIATYCKTFTGRSQEC